MNEIKDLIAIMQENESLKIKNKNMAKMMAAQNRNHFHFVMWAFFVGSIAGAIVTLITFVFPLGL